MPTPKTPSRSDPRSKAVTLKGALRQLQRRLEFKLATLKRSVTPGTVHEARTAARRLLALLHGFRKQLSPSSAHQYHYWLKRVTGDLGTLRDADVARQNVVELVKSANGKCHDTLDTLSFIFDQRRQQLAGKLQAEMARSAWSADMRKLRAAAADPSLILPSGPPIAAVTTALRVDRRQRMRARLRNATRSKHALHRLRIKEKRLRYFLEESAGFGAGLGSAREARLLKGLQDSLGQLHDLVVLAELSKDDEVSRAARKILRKKCDARWKRLLGDYDESRVALLRFWDTIRVK